MTTILGAPNMGIHRARIGPFAFWDLVGTIILAAITAYYFGKGRFAFFWHLLGWFVIGEILHMLFGVNTAFVKIIYSTMESQTIWL